MKALSFSLSERLTAVNHKPDSLPMPLPACE
jgi:hypothetical protein